MPNTEEFFNFQKKNMIDLGYDFFQNPTRENFVKIILKNTGEQDNLDFKARWIEEQKLAEIILGIANFGNGAIILGVEEFEDGRFESKGLDKFIDKADITSKLYRFLPNELKFEIFDFDFRGEIYSKLQNKLFQIIIIYSEDEKLPYILDNNINGSIKGTIYYRKGTKNLQADSESIKEMIKRRLQAEKSIQNSLDFKDHLEQIKLLYEYYSKSNFYKAYNNSFMLSYALFQKDIFNPKDSFEKFLSEAIEKKKKKIEEILEINKNN